ncbi:hypothetical protein QJ854_gp097 [Moumouvirus goulette]|uniref:Uncharacterized protein n=1 Tax=Moumouvirus goulette TaxID=1247379 RepID=M1NNP4_9VIRU|nr:hypothetical protein QJ854_gp097 [Moumouvirus goulette]AGF85685.1 hypothetical protein glt_00882 [Moumouvirus goulette]
MTMFPNEIFYHMIDVSNLESKDILNWIESDKEFYEPILSDIYKEKKKKEDIAKLKKNVGAKPFIPQSKRVIQFKEELEYECGDSLKIEIGNVEIGYVARGHLGWGMTCRLYKNQKPLTIKSYDDFPGYICDRVYDYITWCNMEKDINVSEAICEVWEARKFLRTI